MRRPLPLADSSAATLTDLLRWRAARFPDGGYTFLPRGEEEGARLTWGDLDRRARAVAAHLGSILRPGERALLAFPPGLEFIVGLFGCLYASVVAVPVPLPGRRQGRERFVGIASDAAPRAALTEASALDQVRGLLAPLRGEDLPCLATDALDSAAGETWHERRISPGVLAFIQYTSGSTSEPRGVMVTHANLLHNEAMIRDAFDQDEGSVVVGWLPVHHDMGLIGNVLQPLVSGSRCILMPPLAFAQRPVRWLSAISRYRATTSGGPDFAYDLCVRRISPEEGRSLDLTSWRVAFNGAEPVRRETMERFAAAFAPRGFRREAFRPCYGLAEATLLVSATQVGGRTAWADVEALEEGRFERRLPGTGPCRALESCGRPGGGQDVRVVDPESREVLSDGGVGEIWIAGPSVAEGYWNRPGESAETFRAELAGGGGPRWLRTGDLGFVAGGDLYVTGRRKDLIIVRGRNLYPQDLEETALRSHPSLRPSAAAAFALEIDEEERLALVVEVERQGLHADLDEIIAAIRRSVADEHGVHAAAVALLPPGRLPRTSSGKVRRRACAEAQRRRALGAVAESFIGTLGTVARPFLSPADLAALPEEDRPAVVLDYLRDLVACLTRQRGEDIDADRPLRSLGLDSLAAMELRGALEADLGRKIPVTELLGEITLHALVARLLAVATQSPGTAVPEPRSRRGREEAEPLSHGERALWFLNRLQPESAAYNVAFAAHLGADLDVESLRAAVTDLVARHEVLAGVIDAGTGEPARRILKPPHPPFGVVDATAWAEARLQEEVEREARRGFDLSRDLPLRVHLYRRRDGAHVALLVIHHIAVDFWSLAAILDELGAIYSARLAGRPVSLREPSVRYRDFVRWQERLLASEEGDRLLRRWRERLAGDLPRIDLPTDRARPPVQGSRGRSVPFTLSRPTLERLQALAVDRGTTLFAVLLASFALFLRRYTARDDLIVGTPMACRGSAGLSEVVGYLANLVPLRIDASGDVPFSVLVDRSRSVLTEALELQEIPFPLLVERLAPRRDPSRHPLVQAVIALEKPHRLSPDGIAGFVLGEGGSELSLGDLRLRSTSLAPHGSPFDLTVVMLEAEGCLRGSWRCNADLFTEQTARRMASHFVTLAEAAADRPGARLSELPLLGEEERIQVIEKWNETAIPYPASASIHDLFAEQARERPEVCAGAAGERRLTYRELERLSDEVARRLRALGTEPEDRVAVLLERNVTVPAVLLGILKAGAAYLPLDPGYPLERLRLMTADAGVRAVVTERSLASSALLSGMKLVTVEDLLADPSPSREPLPPARVWPDSAAYVMYTSGSTGIPKGVVVPHRAVVRLVRNVDYAHLGPDEVVLQAAPLGFDASTFEIWGALLNGGRLVIHQGSPASLSGLGAAIAEHGVSTLWLTAGLFHLMVEERLEDLRPLRQLLAGGDVLSPPHVARALAGLRGVRLINGYGPTEATTFACCHLIEEQDAAAGRIPVGRPISNTRAYVLDESGRPAPVGVPGELYLAGDGLARGYLNRPDLTAERFVPDCIGAEAGGRLYRTGDRVLWRAGGRLEFLGRRDDQVKVRGFRVEPGEVEAALASHARVGGAAVVAQRDATGTRLVAYVAVKDGLEPPDPGELRGHVASLLPPYLVPSLFVVVPSLPLSPNGKVDRAALPPPPAQGRATKVPVDGLVGRIAGVWAEVLGVGAVDVDRNLFELGAHSLAVAKAQARLEARLGREIPVVDLFAHPTVRALAEHLRGAPGGIGKREGLARAEVRRAARLRRGGARRLERIGREEAGR